MVFADSRHLGWSARLWPATEHYNFLGHSGGAGVGQIAPGAVGAALANRDKGILTAVIQQRRPEYAPGVLWTRGAPQDPILMLMHNNRPTTEVMHMQKMAGLHNRRMDTARSARHREPGHRLRAARARAGRVAEADHDPARSRRAAARGAVVKRGEPR